MNTRPGNPRTPEENAPAGHQPHPHDQKSWRTSHLPELPKRELQVLLDIPSCWYNQQKLPIPKDCDWPILWEYIDRHGLSGIAGSLALDDLADFPKEIDQAATHRYFSNQLYYEQAVRCCSMVQEAAQKHNIPVTAMKGPAISFQGYKDNGTRSFCDIDLFSDKLASIQTIREELQSPLIKASANQNPLEKLGESECLSFRLENWELEFRYPFDPPANPIEPMFDVLTGNKEQLLQIPTKPNDIIDPDPSTHLIFIIQHMAVHHLFSRFFWFLDLAVLIREQVDRMDFQKIEKELDRIGQRNAAAVATAFCKKHIDPHIPCFTPKLPAWNYPIMNRCANPRDIANGRFGIYHKNTWRKILGYLYGIIGFYIIEDPVRAFFPLGFGTRWTLHRMKNSLGITGTKTALNFLTGTSTRLVLYPIARLTSWLTCLKTKANN